MNSLVCVRVRVRLRAMRRPLFFLLITACLLACGASGQLTVQLHMDRDLFLLYESIPVTVGIRNYSGRTIQIESGTEQPTLGFVVTDEGGSMVAKVGNLETGQSALVPPGDTVNRTIDLLPVYELRARGSYRIQAIVDGGGLRAMSQVVRFNIIAGREVWSQTVGLPVTEDGHEQYRSYSLVTRRDNKYDLLYVCVKDEPNALVYGMLPLGAYVALGEPDVRVDMGGHLHILHRSGARSFTYTQVDPYGKIVDQAVFSDLLSQPRLVIDADGLMAVQGGEKTYPRDERVMTAEELQPLPPPPPPPKKSWWPFGHRKPPPSQPGPAPAPVPAQSQTNAPTTNFGPR